MQIFFNVVVVVVVIIIALIIISSSSGSSIIPVIIIIIIIILIGAKEGHEPYERFQSQGQVQGNRNEHEYTNMPCISLPACQV